MGVPAVSPDEDTFAVGDNVDVYGDVDVVDAACVLAGVVQEYVTAP